MYTLLQRSVIAPYFRTLCLAYPPPSFPCYSSASLRNLKWSLRVVRSGYGMVAMGDVFSNDSCQGDIAHGVVARLMWPPWSGCYETLWSRSFCALLLRKGTICHLSHWFVTTSWAVMVSQRMIYVMWLFLKEQLTLWAFKRFCGRLYPLEDSSVESQGSCWTDTVWSSSELPFCTFSQTHSHQGASTLVYRTTISMPFSRAPHQ